MPIKINIQLQIQVTGTKRQTLQQLLSSSLSQAPLPSFSPDFSAPAPNDAAGIGKGATMVTMISTQQFLSAAHPFSHLSSAPAWALQGLQLLSGIPTCCGTVSSPGCLLGICSATEQLLSSCSSDLRATSVVSHSSVPFSSTCLALFALNVFSQRHHKLCEVALLWPIVCPLASWPCVTPCRSLTSSHTAPAPASSTATKTTLPHTPSTRRNKRNELWQLEKSHFL